MHAGPVIVLTYAESGSVSLRNALGTHPDLYCTSGTGLLPLCQQAVHTWRLADEREGISSLAASSIRAFVSCVMTSILARGGKARWCEIATASTDCAETLLRLYPGTRFVCLHRHCADVVYSGIRANPWGLADSVFWPFAQRFPGSSVAAIAAYWAAAAGPLLEFEAAHPAACHRVRYEDMVTKPEPVMSEILDFLDLSSDDREAAGAGFEQAPEPEATAPFRALPPALLTQVNKVLAALAYPALA